MTRRFVGALLALVCLAALLVGPGGAEASIPRAHIKWTVADGCPPPGADRKVCPLVKPGETAVIDISIEAQQVDVVNPRLVLQTPNGARIMRLSSTAMPTTLAVGGPPHQTQIVVDVPPGFRNSKSFGRLYVADKGSVLVPPLTIDVGIVHPTPAELALTPVIVPTNNIRLLNNRFNIREFTVVNATNLTWTNKDVRQHAVKGTLCDPTWPYNRLSKCTFDGSALAADCNAPDLLGRIPCIDSGPLDPEGNFTLRMVRPSTRELVRYYMEDGLGVADSMTGYLTVK